MTHSRLGKIYGSSYQVFFLLITGGKLQTLCRWLNTRKTLLNSSQLIFSKHSSPYRVAYFYCWFKKNFVWWVVNSLLMIDVWEFGKKKSTLRRLATAGFTFLISVIQHDISSLKGLEVKVWEFRQIIWSFFFLCSKSFSDLVITIGYRF